MSRFGSSVRYGLFIAFMSPLTVTAANQPVNAAQFSGLPSGSVISIPSSQITGITISGTNNMYFRVNLTFVPTDINGTSCSSGSFFYLNASDDGAADRIKLLEAAIFAGKTITPTLTATDFYANGSLYCHLSSDVGVSN